MRAGNGSHKTRDISSLTKARNSITRFYAVFTLPYGRKTNERQHGSAEFLSRAKCIVNVALLQTVFTSEKYCPDRARMLRMFPLYIVFIVKLASVKCEVEPNIGTLKSHRNRIELT